MSDTREDTSEDTGDRSAHAPDAGRQPDERRLALDRTVLANERTWLSWLRTGLAVLAGGLAVARFMKSAMPAWTALLVGSLLVMLSIAIFLLASWRYTHVHLRMAGLDIDAMPSRTAYAISGFLASCALIALIGLWLMAMSG